MQTGRAMKSLLSPKELGQAIGVSESSLKRWADNGHLQVARTVGGHRRIYLSEAVRFIRECGFPVVRPEILGFSELGHEGSEPVTTEALRAALESGDEAVASGMVMHAYLQGHAVAELIDEVIAPVMRQLGERWCHDDQGILIEHRASEMCMQTLSRIRHLQSPNPSAPTAIGSASNDDFHSLPSLMAATVLASRGWPVINLASHTPATVLAQAAREHQAALVWLALSRCTDPDAARASVVEVREALAGEGVQAPLVVGGTAIAGATAPPPQGVEVLPNMAALDALARRLSGRAQGAQAPVD